MTPIQTLNILGCACIFASGLMMILTNPSVSVAFAVMGFAVGMVALAYHAFSEDV